MFIARSLRDLGNFKDSISSKNRSTGFVPTMGALHRGHLELVKQTRKSSEIVIVSIFVNPTQFNNTEDFEKYPITLESDLELLKNEEVDCAFLPQVSDMYPNGIQERINLNYKGLCDVMEGINRPGHFEGMATIVFKLFDAVKPHRAFFGEKDFQQLAIVRLLAKQFFPNLSIIGVSTMREKSGLAMSSRNKRLSRAEKVLAENLSQALFYTKKNYSSVALDALISRIKKSYFQDEKIDLDYFEIRDETDFSEISTISAKQKPRAFVAARINQVRLIDNMSLID